MWLRRRSAVILEGRETGEFEPQKIEDPDNVADMHTKYLPYKSWYRHVWTLNNLNEARVASAIARMHAVRKSAHTAGAG